MPSWSRRWSPRAGNRGLLSPADRVLITIVCLRQVCSPIRLTDLLGVNANSLGQAIAESRPLLNDRRMIAASTLQFSTATELRDFVSSGQSVPARAQAPHLFAAPELTGMPRTDLIALIEWVRPVLNTRSERHRHRRRGGEHLPGAPGGVFTLRITGDEPVVATAGDQRKPGTQGTLAELGYVSWRTISHVVGEVGPIRTQIAHTQLPTATRSPNADAILDPLDRPGAPRHDQINSLRSHKIAKALSRCRSPRTRAPRRRRRQGLRLAGDRRVRPRYGARCPGGREDHPCCDRQRGHLCDLRSVDAGIAPLRRKRHTSRQNRYSAHMRRRVHREV